MDKFLYYNELFLVYKDLIKESHREIFDLYYGENMTMQEIADLKKVSKSRIGVIIKSVEEKLFEYEDKLRIVLKNTLLENALELNDIKAIKKEIDKVINIENYQKEIDREIEKYHQNKGE